MPENLKYVHREGGFVHHAVAALIHKLQFGEVTLTDEDMEKVDNHCLLIQNIEGGVKLSIADAGIVQQLVNSTNPNYN